MNFEQTITDVDVGHVSTLLAQLREQFERLLGRLADAELQLEDVRSERDEEHQLAEHLRTALENSAAIEQAIGVIAAKAGIGILDARERLKGYSRAHGHKIRVDAARIIAAQDPKSPSYGDPGVANIIASVGIPHEFWGALTLNGAIFE